MSKTKEVKTNAMRMLDRMKIPYEAHTYECEEFVDGIQVDKEAFDAINIDEIENISVLKDASAAVYGSRAANGESI